MCLEKLGSAAIFGFITVIVGLILWWLTKVLFSKTNMASLNFHILLLFMLGFILYIGLHYYEHK